MDFKAQYLQAMREKAPALFKRLCKSGDLEKQAAVASKQAERMFREMTKDAPKDKHGQLSLQARREAEEYVTAEFVNFQNSETTLEQDERDYLLVGDRPLLSPEETI
jgi:hypothetical protein